ncbi:hypothetical protein L211DRAFT_801426 [Terfezia boudieri ATCC MYA-4762]|uniref:EF-hand domain-containing protein n=1 Tax=Terfezia boudieri ATCC MYA-4762 TaxID=1051890 RepID=A0A3N4M4A4_9PEZI|nr:hypothetical protein L211DRAFT_801426 [Terfezia boudieri ATCC MYA-4762]
MLSKILSISTAAAALLLSAPLASAHGIHSDADRDHTGLSWAEIHMLEEHHIGNFDPSSFFHLHDFDASTTWTPAEILRTYGIDRDRDGEPIPESTRAHVVTTIMNAIDLDSDGGITLDEFLAFHEAGNKLPDFGLGVGAHGDDEYEYEIHHFEKYHSESDTEEMLNHPEDIAHFKHHEELEAAQERLAELEKRSIVMENIPLKFRRG